MSENRGKENNDEEQLQGAVGGEGTSISTVLTCTDETKGVFTFNWEQNVFVLKFCEFEKQFENCCQHLV